MHFMFTQKIMRNKSQIVNLILAIISGSLLILSFPRFNWYFVSWIALTPLLIAIYRASFKGALICGLVAGVFFFGGLLYWIFLFGLLAGFSLILFQALFISFFGFAAKVIHNRFEKNARLVLIPALWVSLEYFRSAGFWGFSWGVLGYSQHNFLPVIQIARWTGVFGVSFLLVFVNEILTESYMYLAQQKASLKKSVKVILGDVALVLLVIFLWVGVGVLNLARVPEDQNEIRVAILQPSIPQEIKWEPMKKEDIFRSHLKLAEEAVEESPYIIIWPEAAVPAYLLEEEGYLQEIRSLACKTDSYLLVGGLYSNEGRYYNSAFLFSPEGEILERYDKVRLVPFGEYVPLRSIFSNIRAVATVSVDTSPGEKFTVFNTDAGKFSTVICFESTDSFIVRRMAKKGAEILVIMTNDGWFKRTTAADQHISMAVLRAVENDFFVIQAANTGVAAIIDPTGKVLSRTALFERRYLAGNVVFKKSETFYKRFGDFFAYLCLLISAGGLVLATLKKRKFDY